MVRGTEFPFPATFPALPWSRHWDCYLQATDQSGHHTLESGWGWGDSNLLAGTVPLKTSTVLATQRG